MTSSSSEYRTGAHARPYVRIMSRRRRGAALILVVVVIAALLAISAPFVVSMRLHERSARGFHADVRSRQLAESARNRGIAHLMRTHPDEERRAREARGDRASDDEGADTVDELTLPDTPAAGLRPVVVANATGEMSQVEIADARGRLDLNSCGPDPIANLLGVTITTSTISYEEDEALPIEDATPFFSDGDPDTADGFVRVNGEYLVYKHIALLAPARTGDPPRPALMGLGRRAFFSGGPPPDEADDRREYHPVGSLVQDGRAWKVAFDSLWRYVGTDREGQLARFEGPAAIRRIADWEFGTLRAAMVLQQYGVNLAKLRGWGISQDTILGAGLDPELLGAEDAAETPEEEEAREEAEKKLTRWGISVDGLKKSGGTRAVLRAFEQLNALEDDQRAVMIERYKERAEAMEQRQVKLDGWLKDELKRQLRDLTEMRDNAPHLETIGRVELEEKIRPFMTTDSPPLGEAWSEPQVVTQPIQFQAYQPHARIKLQEPRRFMTDMIVRVQLADRTRPPEFRFCAGVRRDEAVLLFPQLDWEYEANTAEVSAKLPSPLNVNTAPREVLRAALVGLMSRVGQKAQARTAAEMVTPAEAKLIAQAIIDEPPASHQALNGLLRSLQSAGDISDHDVDAVFRNAVDPMDAVLLRSSIPFCYASGDVYEVTATGIVNDPAGLEVGRRRFREAVRVAPPRDLVWTIDSQWDFSDRLYVGGPLGPGVKPDPRDGGIASLFLGHAWSNLLQTRPTYLGPYKATPGLFPSTSHGPGEGDIQPLLSHEPDYADGNQNVPSYPAQGSPSGGPTVGALREERPDQASELDGVVIQGVSVPKSEVGVRHFQWENGAVSTSLGPGSFRAWVRVDTPPAIGSRGYVFDGGKVNFVDRLSLYFDGPRELVLALDDEALDTREATALGLPPRATELRFTLPKPVVAGNWYHIAAHWKGAEPNDLALFIDGRSGGTVTLGSRLSSAIDPWSGVLPVVDASGFPPTGFVRVNGYRWASLPTRNDRGLNNTASDSEASCEVLYYAQKSGNNLICGTPPISELQNLIAQGATLAGPPQPNPGPIPTNGRRPQRGSGRRYQFSFNVPGATRNPVQVQVSLGFAHPAGTLVIPYGYHSQVKNEAPPPISGGYQEVVRRGGATLVHPLPRNTPATVLYKPVPTYTTAQVIAQGANFDFYPPVLTPAETVIPLLWGGIAPDAPGAGALPPRPTPGPGQTISAQRSGIEAAPNQLGGWPPMGIVRIISRNKDASFVSNERVLYRGLDPIGGRLLNCVRGVEGTTAMNHFLWGSVVLESIVVTDPTDYPDRPTISDPRVYVSLTQQAGGPNELTEWLSVQKCADPQLAALGLMMIPVFDILALPPGAGVLFSRFGPLFPYEPDLIAQMLTLNGNLGAAPGLLTVADPLDPEFGQPYKEVLKRWDFYRYYTRLPMIDGPRAAKNTQRPIAGVNPITSMHPTNTRVVPVFAVRVDDRYESGAGDIVTIVDDQAEANSGAVPPREEQRIVHGAEASFQANAVARAAGLVGDTCDGWLVAFDDFVQRRYLGAANARLARWPVGNLHTVPDLTLGRAHPPAVQGDTVSGAPGVLAGRIDDLSSHQLHVRLEEIAPLDAIATTGLMKDQADQLRVGRLYKVDDEIIGVVDASPGQAPPGSNGGWANVTLVRGALGTTPTAHGHTFAWRLVWPAHAVADGVFAGNRGSQLPVRGIQTEVRANDGYMAIDRGVNSHPRWALQPFLAALPYAERGRGDRSLTRPLDTLDRGAFTTAFGSDAAAPVAGDLLIDLPFRPHDRYADRLWSYEGVAFQAARELTGGYVTHVDWDEVLASPFCEVKVALRCDGAPAWDAEPADRPGLNQRLYLFDDPKQPNQVLVRADRVEVRVYLTFKPGAFYEDAWKRAALVGSVRVHYRQPSASLRREERSD